MTTSPQSTDNELVFGAIREHVYRGIWIAETKREALSILSEDGKYEGLFLDSYADSFECDWQNNAGEVHNNGFWHVPHFCSLGEWAKNITDILTDERFDKLSFVDELDQGFLFRQYTRLLLIVSEMLADFEDIMGEMQLGPNTKERRDLLSVHFNVDQLHQYINTVCKHKSRRGLHLHNHHLPYWFEDSNLANPFKNPLSLEKPTHTTSEEPKPDGISIPSLPSIILAVTDGYKVLDKLFSDNSERFNEFCGMKGIEYYED